MPLAVASALILLAAGRFLLGVAELLSHPSGLFAGTGPLATVILLYLVLLEIPGRRLVLGPNAITIKSWFDTKVVAWTEVADVQPGTSGWMNVNRRWPVAARLIIRGTAEAVPIPDVFTPKRRQIHDLVRSHWIAARAQAAGPSGSTPVDARMAATTASHATQARYDGTSQ